MGVGPASWIFEVLTELIVMNGVITVITPTNDRKKNGLTGGYFTLRITPNDRLGARACRRVVVLSLNL